MKLLIDGDLIAYEAASAADMVDEGMERRNFDYCIEYVDNKIADICEVCDVANPHRVFLTGGGNFRFDIATVKPYKGTRKDEKPFYLPSVRKYMEAKHKAIVVEGMEADDALAIVATQHMPWEVTIASRDKDLKQVHCFHYTWECGKQPEWGPELITEMGDIDVKLSKKILKNGEPSKAIDKISGTGLKWFYTQCITGDTTDNIPGLEGKGAGLAYELLKETDTEKEMYERVLGAYTDKYAEKGAERLLEQGRLLWMCRTRVNGKAVMWELPVWS